MNISRSRLGCPVLGSRPPANAARHLRRRGRLDAQRLEVALADILAGQLLVARDITAGVLLMNSGAAAPMPRRRACRTDPHRGHATLLGRDRGRRRRARA